MVSDSFLQLGIFRRFPTTNHVVLGKTMYVLAWRPPQFCKLTFHFSPLVEAREWLARVVMFS